MIKLFLENYSVFLEGMMVTVLASIIALIASVLIGGVFALMQISGKKFLQAIANCYIEFFRNIPLLVIVMFFYVVLPILGITLSGFVAGTIGLAIYTSAFIAVDFITSIKAINQGQMEAGCATGLSYWQVLFYIVLPQAIKIALPPLGNRFVSLIKDSAILAMVAGFDLMYQADLVASNTFQTFYVYSLIACCYLVLTIPMSQGMKLLERKLA